MAESRVRQLSKAIQSAARTLRPLAIQDPSLVKAYNSLCGVLDALNKKLARESAGKIISDWEKISAKVSR